MRSFVTGVYKGRTQKSVSIAGLTTETDDQILDMALSAANETRVRIFGSRIEWLEDHYAVVYLYTA